MVLLVGMGRAMSFIHWRDVECVGMNPTITLQMEGTLGQEVQ